MAEIDLIPVEYRDWLSRKSTLVKYSVALASVNAIIITGGLLLGHSVTQYEARAAELRTENAIAQQQHAELQRLTDEQNEYERRWSLLRGLRAGAAVDDIFSLIDKSIVAGDLWFIEWSFRRAGVIVDGQQRGIETGYFIIVDDEQSVLANQDLSIETHMTIHGQAKDHQALSTFVRALFEQNDIKDVNVQKTSQTDYADGRVVEFDMTVVLNSAFRES